VTPFACPHCDAAAVVSRFEWVRVYNWRAQLRERGPAALADALVAAGAAIPPDADAETWVREWAHAESPGPEHICAQCVTPVDRREVGRDA